MKVTIRSVAERAGVSLGTVSRVLNRDPSVDPELSRRVLDTVESLGYVPLRKKRKDWEDGQGLDGKTIGLLTLGMDRSLSQLPVVTAAIDGIREAVLERGGRLQLFDAPDPAEAPTWLRQARCDAWLVKGAMQGALVRATNAKLLGLLETSPCVWFHGRPDGAPGFGVGVNDWAVGTIAADHLFESGHRQVAFISPKSDHALLRRRQHGFVARCEELGISCSVHSKNLQSWKFPLERPKSLAAISNLLENALSSASKPTAIFAPADSIAVLLYRALAEQGLKIPDDVSLISVNRDEGLIAGLYPSLTTVDIHASQVGREAVCLLERSIQMGRDLPPQDVQVAPSLFVADSVRAI